MLPVCSGGHLSVADSTGARVTLPRFVTQAQRGFQKWPHVLLGSAASRVPSALCYNCRMRAIFCCLFLLLSCSLQSVLAEVNPSWTTPIAPFRIADNLYYVGSQDLAAYLVTTHAGNILINANLPSSPAQIKASVEQLGFRWKDTKILLVGQAHMDHAGGAAQIERETGAKLKVMEFAPMLQGDAIVVVRGRVSMRDDGMNLHAFSLMIPDLGQADDVGLC